MEPPVLRPNGDSLSQNMLPYDAARVHVACRTCRQVKAACSHTRPCDRCIRVGNAHSCVDALPGEGSRRHRKKATEQPKLPTPTPLPLPQQMSSSYTASSSSSASYSASSSPPSPRVQFDQSLSHPQTQPAIVPSSFGLVSPESTPSLSLSPAPSAAFSVPTTSVSGPVVGPSPLVPTRTFVYSNDDRDTFYFFHSLLLSPETRTEQLITGTAWIVHNMAQTSPEYALLLLSARDNRSPSPPNIIEITSDGSHSRDGDSQHPQSPPALEQQTLIGEDTATSMFQPSQPFELQLQLRTQRQRANHTLLSSIPLFSTGVSEAQHLLALLLSQSSTSGAGTQWNPLRARSNPKGVRLPPMTLPPGASDSDKQCYALMDVWKNTPCIQQTVQKYYAWPLPVDMPLLLRAERTRSGSLPFGVVIYPMYPRPFAVYPHWVNKRFATMLGYDQNELNELIKNRSFYWSLYYGEDRMRPKILPYRAIVAGQRNITFPMRYIRKDGRVVPTIMSVMFKYFDRLPIYGVVFVQEIPPGPPALS